MHQKLRPCLRHIKYLYLYPIRNEIGNGNISPGGTDTPEPKYTISLENKIISYNSLFLHCNVSLNFRGLTPVTFALFIVFTIIISKSLIDGFNGLMLLHFKAHSFILIKDSSFVKFRIFIK